MADIVPDEMYVLFRHNRNVRRFPDHEEVDWIKMDKEYFIGEPGPRFTYSRQGQDGTFLAIPSDDAWQKFLDQLDEIDVFSWKSVKTSKDNEGGHIGDVPRIWIFEICRPGMKKFHKSGPIDKLPPNFDRFCEALSELMGGQKFGPE